MGVYERWYEDVSQFMSQQALPFLFDLVFAVIVLIVGWVIAAGIGRLVADVLKRVQFNQIFERAGWQETLNRADIKVDPSAFVGAIFKWVLVVVVLLAIADIFGLAVFAAFLADVLGYLPNVLAAALIFVAAVLIADIVEKILRASVEGMRMGYGHVITVIVKWSIWIFAVFAILDQLGVAQDIVTTFVQGIVFGVAAFVAIAGGLAFGFGGKDMAAETLQDLKKKFKQ